MNGNISKGIEDLVIDSKIALSSRLEAIFLFGSANTTDFIVGISDLDFIYLTKGIDYHTLTVIGILRRNAKSSIGCKVDIKPFTSDEFNAGVAGKGSFEFFNGWGLEMMRRGMQRALYLSPNISLDYKISEERLKSDSLERAH